MKRSLKFPKNLYRDSGMVEMMFSILVSLIILEYLNSCIIRDYSHFIKGPLPEPYRA